MLPSYEESERGNNHNNYFGMRYDVTFKIGDYVGPLNYKFTGDDDLWVVLDGKKIVIDLGGIHSAATGNVDLWNYIGQAANLTEAQKQQTHTLTIVFLSDGDPTFYYKKDSQGNITGIGGGKGNSEIDK